MAQEQAHTEVADSEGASFAELAEVLAVATDAVLAAGQADLSSSEAEALASRAIALTFPSHEITSSKEIRTSDAPAANWTWEVVSSTGSAVGQDVVALLASQKDKPLVAALYDTARCELFTAVKGIGAELNGSPLRVSPRASDLKDAVVGAWPSQSPYSARPCLRGLYTLSVPTCADVRLLGDSLLSLAWVACGRLDAFFTLHWAAGTGAGMLLVQEAGGSLTACDGSELPATIACRGDDFVSLCATSKVVLNQQLTAVLRSAQATQTDRPARAVSS